MIGFVSLVVLFVGAATYILVRTSRDVGRSPVSPELQSAHWPSTRDSDPLRELLEREQLRRDLSSIYLGTVDLIRSAKRERRYQDALSLCFTAIDATEKEAARCGGGVAPWYYEQAAIIYRKIGDRSAEIAVLRRYQQQPHAPGAKPAQLVERLRKLEARTVPPSA